MACLHRPGSRLAIEAGRGQGAGLITTPSPSPSSGRKAAPAASREVWRRFTVRASEFDPFSNLETVITPTMARSARSRTLMPKPARAMRHWRGVIIRIIYHHLEVDATRLLWLGCIHDDAMKSYGVSRMPSQPASPRPATIINFQAARAARGLPVAPLADAPAAYQIGQPVTVLGRPIRYGWVVGIRGGPRYPDRMLSWSATV